MKYASKESRLIQPKNTMEIELGLNDTKKAIELLYSQYKMPIQTCVQELVSNAFDASQDSKVTTPVRIELPDDLNSYTFSVRDFGNSMCKETIKNVYMKVNASTKANNNKAIGGYGIGSKTPWAYTDAFVLTTFLNGQETKYLMVKGRNSVSIIHEGITNEPNGTKVEFSTLIDEGRIEKL